MTFSALYREVQPTREEVEQMSGPILLEFGASWCGHCLALEPHLKKLLAEHPQIQHLRIADGRGKPLGRSFRVKLWPTLVLMHDGQILAELVRPSAPEVEQMFSALP